MTTDRQPSSDEAGLFPGRQIAEKPEARCRFCEAEVSPTAKACRHCGRRISWSEGNGSRRELNIALIIAGALVLGLIVLVIAVNNGSGTKSKLVVGDVLSDVFASKSTGYLTSTELHADCVDVSDLVAYNQSAASGMDEYKRREAQQMELFKQARCTYIAVGTQYDVDAEGREVFHTPHGTISLWPSH